jgi:DNA-binding MarR family transcriptional regulator
LSAHQASILSHLDAAEPTRMTELARHMGVTLSTMSLAVTRLLRQGYVTRRRNPKDGRAVELRLTPQGVRIKDAQTVLDIDKVRRLLARIPVRRRAQALAGLHVLAEAAAETLAERSARPSAHQTAER